MVHSRDMSLNTRKLQILMWNSASTEYEMFMVETMLETCPSVTGDDCSEKCVLSESHVRQQDTYSLLLHPQLADVYGNVFCIRLGRHKTVFVSGWRMVKEALVTQADNFVDRPYSPMVTRIYSGNSGKSRKQIWVLKEQYVRIGHQSNFILWTNRGQHTTRATANCNRHQLVRSVSTAASSTMSRLWVFTLLAD